MKAIIVILTLIAIAGLFAAATGVERISIGGSNATVVHHSAAGRVAAAAIGAICAVAAYGCRKRKLYAWWLVTALTVALAGYAVVWTIWKMTTTNLDFFGNLLGALGQAVKIGFLIWFLVALWLPKKKEFSREEFKSTT